MSSQSPSAQESARQSRESDFAPNHFHPDEPRVPSVRDQFEYLDEREFQLWSIGALVLIIVAMGFFALLFPEFIWNLGIMRFEGRYLPQLAFGFIVLVVLVNIYQLEQRRRLRETRRMLIDQVSRAEHAERMALLDPLTECFNRRYMEHAIASDVARANRSGNPLSFVIIDLDDFKDVNNAHGHQEGDRLLKEVANVLRRTFRGSDTIVRYGGDEFFVILPNTDGKQSEMALGRLQLNVNQWNAVGSVPYKMSITAGFATYDNTKTAREVIEAADRNMYERKEQRKKD